MVTEHNRKSARAASTQTAPGPFIAVSLARSRAAVRADELFHVVADGNAYLPPDTPVSLALGDTELYRGSTAGLLDRKCLILRRLAALPPTGREEALDSLAWLARECADSHLPVAAVLATDHAGSLGASDPVRFERLASVLANRRNLRSFAVAGTVEMDLGWIGSVPDHLLGKRFRVFRGDRVDLSCLSGTSAR